MGELAGGTTLPFLTSEQVKEFNLIGYSGKDSSGSRMSQLQYLNTINPGREIFEMECINRASFADFCQEFIVTRVVINP
jgi:hypothetical protein